MTIHYGDCLTVMEHHIDDNTIDLIVTSPPYAELRAHTYGGIPANEYVDWWMPRAQQMRRVLKPTGSLILNIKEGVTDGERQTYVLELVQTMRQAGWKWIDEYIWHKPNPMPGNYGRRLKDGWEHLHHFAPTLTPAFYPDNVTQPLAPETLNSTGYQHHRHQTTYPTGRQMDWQRLADRQTARPSNVITCGIGGSIHSGSTHTAQYPEQIPQFFINLLTTYNNHVLDPFLGSGTTYRVAKAMNRQATGIEINPNTHITLHPPPKPPTHPTLL